MTNPFTSKNYYERLNVPRNADKAQITKAYHEIASVFHPDSGLYDKNGGDLSETHLEIFKCIGEAYSVLSDDAKRAVYDSTLKESNSMSKGAQVGKKTENQQSSGWNSIFGEDSKNKTERDDMSQRFRERVSAFDGGGEIRSSINIGSILESTQQRSSVVRSAVFEGSVKDSAIDEIYYDEMCDNGDLDNEEERPTFKARLLQFLNPRVLQEKGQQGISTIFREIFEKHTDAVIITIGLLLGMFVCLMLLLAFT